MLPTAASAFSSCSVARREAKVSGSDVPSATRVSAVTKSPSPTIQPKSEAISPTTAVHRPTNPSETTNAGQPINHVSGGTSANWTCARHARARPG